VTPADPYGPFPYANSVQHDAFDAYIRCASEHGVEYLGPFAASNGKGVMFKLAEGEQPSHATRQDVEANCPMMIVGIFATPVPGGSDRATFVHAGEGFVTCLRSEGVAVVSIQWGHDLSRALEQIPFDWESEAFVTAVSACTEALQSFIFSGLG
jgi:hypothetical protein